MAEGASFSLDIMHNGEFKIIYRSDQRQYATMDAR